MGGGRIYHETHYAPMLRMQGRVREIALDIRRADGSRLPALINAALKTDEQGEPILVRTTVFDATERQRYERELRGARDRERAARERADALQRLTAAVAAAPDAAAIARAVVDALARTLGADRAGLAAPREEGGTPEVLARHGDPVAADLQRSPGSRRARLPCDRESADRWRAARCRADAAHPDRSRWPTNRGGRRAPQA